MKIIKAQPCLLMLVTAVSLLGCVSAPEGANSAEIVLSSRDAVIHSERLLKQLQIEEPNGNLGYWHNTEEYVTWDVKIEKPMEYKISVKYASWGENAGSAFKIEIGGQELPGVFKSTSTANDGYFAWGTLEVGKVKLEAGPQVLTMKVTKIAKEAAGNILEVIIAPAAK